MYIINRFFIELSNAIRLSKSKLPQEKQLAVILFDHLIEIVLYNAVRKAFEWPVYLPVQESLNTKAKKEALHKYDRVISFLKKNGYLKDNDQALLAFTHGIRNELYHKGKDEIDNTVLALTIYFDFITRNKIILTKRDGLTRMSGQKGYEPLDFGQGLKKDNLHHFINVEKYVDRTFDHLISTLPDLGKFQELAFAYCSRITLSIENDLKYLDECRKNYNYYEAIAYSTLGETAPIFREYADAHKKPASIDSILITANFLRNFEDELNDYPPEQRLKYSKNKWASFRKGKGKKYSGWVKMERIKERISKLKKDKLEVAVQNFGGITSEMDVLHKDVSFAAMIYGGYETVLQDWGK